MSKKNKLNKTERRAAAKRGAKRGARLKKTQKEKHTRIAKALLEKKEKEIKFREAMDKLMQARFGK